MAKNPQAVIPGALGRAKTVYGPDGRAKTLIPVKIRVKTVSAPRIGSPKVKAISNTYKVYSGATFSTPETVRLIGLDPKVREVSEFRDILVRSHAWVRGIKDKVADAVASPKPQDVESAMMIGGEEFPHDPVVLSPEESTRLLALVSPERVSRVTPRMRQAAENYKRIMGEVID
jgi:hypothetical protein